MKYIKSHKKEFIILFLAVLVLLVSLIAFLIVWFQGSSNKYGDRLDGIENVALSDSYLGEIISEINKNENVTDSTYNLEGRLLSIHVYVNHDTNKEEIKKLGDIVLSKMKEEELSYYDIQLFIKFDNSSIENEEDTISPIIGYKHKTSDEFVWSNN